MVKVTTVVLRPDGTFYLASGRISLADAERWVDEGYTVFMIAISGKSWAINHSNSGKIFTDDMLGAQPTNDVFRKFLLLPDNTEENES